LIQPAFEIPKDLSNIPETIAPIQRAGLAFMKGNEFLEKPFPEMVCRRLFFVSIIVVLFVANSRLGFSQNTQIRGFADVELSVGKNGIAYSLGEQDLFITSTLNDRLSFLGETIFKFAPASPTKFAASVERIIFNYSLFGNHSLIAGKIHTPINYWNDTYHHGRVFFPTIDRPLLFDSTIIPLHSLGLGIQGKDLGLLKFGYNVFLANGLGSGDIMDNDRYKSITTSASIRPTRNLRIGLSWYHDIISKDALVHGMKNERKTTQNLYSASIANFGKHWEILVEATAGMDKDSLGTNTVLGSYAYLGYRIKDKLIPYLRYDNLRYHGDNHMTRKDIAKWLLGIRYQLNYLAVVKLEYQSIQPRSSRSEHKIVAQIAVGF
jgi:hypothetical protein